MTQDRKPGRNYRKLSTRGRHGCSGSEVHPFMILSQDHHVQLDMYQLGSTVLKIALLRGYASNPAHLIFALISPHFKNRYLPERNRPIFATSNLPTSSVIVLNTKYERVEHLRTCFRKRGKKSTTEVYQSINPSINHEIRCLVAEFQAKTRCAEFQAYPRCIQFIANYSLIACNFTVNQTWTSTPSLLPSRIKALYPV